MKKRFTILIAAIAAILMMTQPGKVWATDVTFDATKNKTSESSLTIDGITIATSSGTLNNGTDYRNYKGATFTISSTVGKITSVVFTSTSNSYAGYIKITGSTPGVLSVSNSTTTWTYADGATSLTFTGKNGTSNEQIRASEIIVTYTGATNYTVTISNTIANGSVTASPTSAAQNATITLTPSANSGYKLSGWNITKTSDGTASGITPTGPNAQGKYTFSMPAYNVTVGATFSQTYTVTCATGLANGSISAEPATAAAGETITVTANPAANYKLKTLTVTETGGSNTVTPTMGVNSATFTMQAYPVTVSATFVRVYHVTYDANTTDYTGTTTDANVYETGNNATVQANGFSKDGYTFSTWNTQADGQGTDYAPSSTYTIGTADVTLYAQWNIAQYNVAVSSVTGATVSAAYGNNTIAADANANVDCGTVIQLRADGLASGKGIVWDVYKTGETSTKVTVTNNSFTLPAYAVTISGTVGDLFVKYTAETVAEGDYIIYDSKAMNQTINDSRLSLTDISSLLFDNNNTIVSSDASAYTWHIAPNSDYMTISYTANNNTNYYVYTTSTTAAKCIGVKTTVDDAARWTFTRSTNTYLITNKTNANTDYANLVNGGSYYACYSKSTKESSLYKKAASYQVDVTEAANGVVIASTSGQSPIAEGANANIRSGATVTLTVTPDENYTIQSLAVYKTGTPATTVTVTNNQFTMPDYAVTVEVVFRSTATVTLTYSVNGVESSSSVSEGDITLKTSSEIAVPDGYTFAGWSTSPSDFSTLYNGSYSLVGNTTLYAVFSANKPALFSFEITKADFSTGGYATDNDRVRTTTANSIEGKTFNVNWRSNQVYQNNSAMQWQASNGYIYNTTDLGTVKSVTVTVKDSQGSFTTNYGTSQEPSSGSPGAGNGYFKTLVGSVYGLTSKVVVTFEKNVPFYFTRVIGTEEATGDITINGPTIIDNGKSLNMGDNNLECDDPTLLIIEDGGQLIVTNAGVQATVKKPVEASKEETKGAAVNNYYTISSPVKDLTISSFLSTQGDYKHNIYRYDAANIQWQDYRIDNEGNYNFESFINGQGYLFRTLFNGDIEYSGEVNVADQTFTLSYDAGNELKSFNLIGNPFSHNIYKNDNYQAEGAKPAINSNYLTTGYYRLNGGVTWVPTIGYGNPILPGEGVLVLAKGGNGESLTITNTTNPAASYSGEVGAKSGNDNLMFTVSNDQFEDVTYALFSKGYGLNKINHRSDLAPMIYIPQNDENYAIAMMSDNTNSFNLNFEAKTTGKYTLSFKANGEFNYLHVIDRMTGDDVDMLLEGEYSFIGSPMDNPARFIVRLGYLPNYDDNGEDIFAYQNGSDIVVSGEGELQIFDVMGRMVSAQRVNGVETINLNAQGVYIFKLNEKTQKIVVK